MLTNKTAPTIKGDQIGSWKLGETLGLGSTGKVQLAYNKTTDKHAAIKIISKAIFRSQTAAGTHNNNNSFIAQSSTPDSLPYGIEREIIIMKLLNHPNVLRLYDVWETNNNLYMVLEYAEKGELFNLLVERGPLPENEAIRFFRQIIIGISYCHALGIVHRDLKPENLLLDNKYNIKIADFGMAALETEDKLLETSCGSPHYAAPEIVSGIPYHGFASDVWSCGVILFALLTGRLPFDEEDGNIRNLLLKVQSGQFEMPDNDEISNEAQDLISKILIVDPQQRITARDILKHPLLQKYPSIKDSKSIRNLPREDTYLHPLAETNSIVDETILQNLIVLWHGRNGDEIKAKLNERGANAEKTLYALLHRFKMDAEQENIKNEHLRKRQSATSPNHIKNSSYSSNHNRSPNKNISTPQRRKNRTSMISVASSHKRPRSYIKLPSGSSLSSVNVTTPGSSTRGKNQSKRLSKISSFNNESPTPSARNKRLSKIKSDRHSIIINNNSSKGHGKNGKKTMKNGKRLSMLPNMKRGSVTTKLLATYTKLSEDDDWEYIEKETKRTSSDFATLIDEIFEHEKYEQIRKEKEELARKVREAKVREEAERRRKEEDELRKRREYEAQEREKADRQRQMEEEIGNLKKELENLKVQENSNNQDFRSVSAPLEVKELHVAKNDEFNVDDLLRQRNFSLQTRPVSRLDPGLFFEGAESQSPLRRSPTESYHNERVTSKANNVDEKLKTEKMILETIRRSKFLGSSFDINRELRTASTSMQYSAPPTQPPPVVQSLANIQENEQLPDKAIATAPLKSYDGVQTEVRKISDVRVPQFTRKSRHFSESNKRLSVLSLYSTKQSYTNLADIIKENDENADDNSNNEYNHINNTQGDSEFNFESSPDNKSLVNDNLNSKMYEVDDAPEITEKKKPLKLNLADRYNHQTEPLKEEPVRSEPDITKLPVLPPLNSANAGLGIYQDVEDKDHGNVDGKVTGGRPISDHDEETVAETLKEEDIRVAPKPPSKETSKVQTNDNSNEKINVPKQRKAEPEITKQKPRQNSQGATNFLRKLSGGISPTDNTKNGNGNPKNTDSVVLVTSVPPNQLYQGLYNLLRGWASYGIKGVKGNSETRIISGKLSGDNILSLRSTVFEIVIGADGKGSKIQIKKKSGSSKAVRRLIGEVENVLTKEGVLKK